MTNSEKHVLDGARTLLVRFWRGVREWCGDAAYDRYARAHAKHAGGKAPLTREQFYLEELQKRYSRVSRCC